MHYLMHYDFPFYARLTLEFLCTLEINLFKALDKSSVGGLQFKVTDTLSFRLHNYDYWLPVEALGEIMHL